MVNTRQIKRRIHAARNISKITKAMEMVAASKMKRAQDQATAARPYSRALQESLQKIAQHTDSTLHQLLSDHGQGVPVAILVTTEKGLCGNLNTQVFKAAERWLKQNAGGEMIIIGRKGVHFAQLVGWKLHAQFTEFPEKVTTSDIVPITELIMRSFLDQQFRSVTLIYMDFINTLSQQVRTVPLLPIAPSTADVAKYNEAEVSISFTGEYTFEPSARQILDELLPYYIENTVYQALLEARASEHSARMVTMKNASENAGELVGELKLEFNKSRQAAITSELLDISTAALTLS